MSQAVSVLTVVQVMQVAGSSPNPGQKLIFFISVVRID